MTRRVLTYELCKEIASYYPNPKALELADQSVYKKSRENGWLPIFYPGIRKSPGYWNETTCLAAAKSCTTMKEFRTKFRSAYNVALREEWIDNYTWLQLGHDWSKSHNNGYWTKDKCFKAAKKCRTIKEFRTKFQTAYKKSVDKGWYAEYTWLKHKVAARRWTKGTCYAAAKKCHSITEFKTKYSGAYKAAARLNTLTDYTWFTKPQHSKNYWTKTRCYNTAKKCTTLREFTETYNVAYITASRNNWLADYTWLERKQGIYDYEHCRELAMQFTDMPSFRNTYPSAWAASHRNNWLSNFDWLERGLPHDLNKADCVYVYEFIETHTAYIGRSIEPDKREKHHTFDTKSAVFKYSQDTGISIPKMRILESNLSVDQGLDREDWWVKKYSADGWNVLNVAKTGLKSGSVGSLRVKTYTKQNCRIEALKYTKLADFMHNARGFYRKAVAKGWIFDYTWLIRRQLSLVQYDSSNNIVTKYNSLAETVKTLGVCAETIRKSLTANGEYHTKDGFIIRKENLNNDNTEINKVA